MGRSLRIAIADDETDMQEYFRTILPLLGHVVVVVADTGRELVEKCREHRPDLVITDVKMPEMDGLDAIARISHDSPMPVILISAHHDNEVIARALQEHVMSYLIKPIKPADLEPAIAVAMHQFEQFQALRRETASLSQALEDRKTIQSAKALLMKKTQLDESEAFRRLQRLASEQNRKLVEIAKMLLRTEEASH